MTYHSRYPFLLCLLFSLTSATGLYAQNAVNWNLVSLGYGSKSLVQLTEGVHSGEYGYDSRPIINYSGTFSTSFRRYLSPSVAIGLAVAFEHESGDMRTEENYYSSPVKTGTFTRNVYSVAPELLVVYHRKESAFMHAYGYMGAGYTILNEQDEYDPGYYNRHYGSGTNNPARSAVHRNLYPTLQICALGLSLGYRLRAFGELGFGYKGIANMGALLSF